MTSNYKPNNSLSIYLQTSQIYPTEEPEKLKTTLTDTYQRIANNINIRQIGIYDLTENETGQHFFMAGNPQKKRNTYRKVINVTTFNDLS